MQRALPARGPALIGLVAVLSVLAVLAGCAGGGRTVHGDGIPAPTQTLIDVPSPTAAPPPGRHPDILVIEADDMRWDELRWMPNVRRLIQRRGLDFANSFAPYPLCCPSRASFLSGQYAHNHHVYSHKDPFGFQAFDDRTTLATRLQGAGYRTALIGKYLNGYGQQPVPATGTSSLHYVPPGWTRWMAGSDHLWHPGQRLQGGTYNYFRLVQNLDGRIVQWPHRYSTDVLARQTRSVIDRWRTGAPWFIWWTPIAPHFGKPHESDDPGPAVLPRHRGRVGWFTPARPDWVKGLFDRAITHGLGTPVTHQAEADVSDKPRYLRRMPPLSAEEKAKETVLTRQRAEALYVMDLEVGRTLALLGRTRQLRNTLVVFTSDNGYYLGEHRKREGKITLHEPSLRVPLLISGPGIRHGRRYDPATTIDLAPTLAAYAGTTMPGTDGVDLGPVIRSGDRGWTRPVVTEAMMKRPPGDRDFLPGSPLDTRGVRLGRWKLTDYSDGEQELYDLLRDPLELHGLQRDPAHRSMLRRMEALFRRYENCAGAACSAAVPADLRLTPDQERRLTLREIRRTDSYDENAPVGAPLHLG